MLLYNVALDTQVNEGLSTFKAVLKTNNTEYQAYIYPEVNDGSHNNITPRFDKSAAGLSWTMHHCFFLISIFDYSLTFSYVHFPSNKT